MKYLPVFDQNAAGTEFRETDREERGSVLFTSLDAELGNLPVFNQSAAGIGSRALQPISPNAFRRTVPTRKAYYVEWSGKHHTRTGPIKVQVCANEGARGTMGAARTSKTNKNHKERKLEKEGPCAKPKIFEHAPSERSSPKVIVGG